MRNSKHQIVIDGKLRWRINAKLAKQRKLTAADIADIRATHLEKLQVYTLMYAMDPEEDREFLELCDKHLVTIEFELQELWGFERNARYHRFWNRPWCSCPKMDNEEAYGLNRAFVSGHCPLHGRELIEAQDDLERRKAESDWTRRCTEMRLSDGRFFLYFWGAMVLACAWTLWILIGEVLR